ncbi:porin [Ferrimonas pelagia]|uniref:Porin n=1 Tax=Ferrimonas pelagia TaxID=1177826 RepID=A0ABP9EIQ8_9GAMM
MLIQRTALATALLAATLPASVMANTADIYGRLVLTMQANEIAGDSETKIASHSSRFGVRGGHEISAGLEAIYQAEFGMGVTSSTSFSNRNQFVGLKGDFGMTTIGRRDTALKMSRGSVEQFLTYDGDLNKTMGGEVRADQQVSYSTPVIADLLRGEVTYLADDGNGEHGASMAAMLGDPRYAKQPFYAAVAYDSEVANRNILRLTVGGKIAGVEVGAIYSDEEIVNEGDSAGASGASGDAFLVSAGYDLGQYRIMAQYSDGDVPGKANTTYTLGGEYRLSKQLRVNAYYSGVEFDSRDEDDRYLAAGLRYDF